MLKSLKIINVQSSMLNECQKDQSFNALNHPRSDHSLKIDKCKMTLAATGGAA